VLDGDVNPPSLPAAVSAPMLQTANVKPHVLHPVKAPVMTVVVVEVLALPVVWAVFCPVVARKLLSGLS